MIRVICSLVKVILAGTTNIARQQSLATSREKPLTNHLQLQDINEQSIT